jgi:F-type H+-transporting ATPase subunit gamma
MTSRAAGVTRLARRISGRLSSLSSARIVHAHYTGGAESEPRVKPVLPLARPKGDGRGDAPLHHLPPDRLMAALASEYLFAEVADTLMDSLASENAARLRTMDAASRNIDDRLDRLRRDAHVARQEEMTADMLDVVTGAEAIFNG